MSNNPNTYSLPSQFSVSVPYPIFPAVTPESQGAKGDGVTDDTAAWNAIISKLNAGTIYSIQCASKATYVISGSLTTITASHWVLFGNGATLLAKPNSWASVGNSTVMLSVGTPASNFVIRDLILNGNQSNFTADPNNGGWLLGITNASYPQLDNVHCINSVSDGSDWDTVSYGKVNNCHFDNNAYAGWQRSSCSYTKISNTTRSYNGYGYQKTWATNTFVAFGEAVRFQTFGEEDVNGQFLFNGRDGANQNQGSHHNVYNGSIATGNGDGGFTGANDSTSPGRPGDGESPYSIKYVSVEAIANWGSGLVYYSATDDIEYSGRFADNCRLAGSLVVPASAMAGVYFAGGSTNLHPGGPVDTFDDRQTCPITAISGSGSTRTLTVTNWLPGYRKIYNAVALFNANMAFQGYGFITAESAGSVTIQAATQNPVTLSSIATTWYISQCTQTFGVFYDTASTGEINAKGYGLKPNPSFGPNLAMSGPFSSGQNVLLQNGTYGQQILVNPTFDSGVTNWTFSTPGGGSANSITSGGIILSQGCLQLVAGAGQDATGDATLIAGSSNFGGPYGFFLEYSGWVYSAIPQAGVMFLFWNNSALFTEADHPGGGWKFLRIGIFNNDTNGIVARVRASNGNTVYFDSMSLTPVTISSGPNDYARPSYLNSTASAQLYPVPPP